jgi:hypothetical protein
MTVWFIERLGSRVFSERPSPWPDMAPQEAGVNAVKQALYFLLLRPLRAHALRVATRLYNVYGFGYEASANHKEMIWMEGGQLVSGSKAEDPASDGPGERGPDEILDQAWSFYRRGLLQDALARSAAVLDMSPMPAPFAGCVGCAGCSITSWPSSRRPSVSCRRRMFRPSTCPGRATDSPVHASSRGLAVSTRPNE